MAIHQSTLPFSSDMTQKFPHNKTIYSNKNIRKQFFSLSTIFTCSRLQRREYPRNAHICQTMADLASAMVTFGPTVYQIQCPIVVQTAKGSIPFLVVYKLVTHPHFGGQPPTRYMIRRYSPFFSNIWSFIFWDTVTLQGYFYVNVGSSFLSG